MTQAEFVQGELIRVVKRDRLVVDLHRDGTFVLGGRVCRNFLALSDKEDLPLHPLALIEVTVNFTKFQKAVLEDFCGCPKSIHFRIELRNMHLGGQKTLVARLSGGFTARHERIGSTMASESYDPIRVALLLVRELYLWFGHSAEAIPYSLGIGDERMIAANQIAGVH